MKKIISIVLLLTLCLGLFAGCDQKPAETTSNLANAKALVFNTYKPANKDEIPAKSADFELMTSVLVDGVSYPVSWTVQVTEGAADAVKIVDGSSSAFKKVDLTEKPETLVKFTLTATISDKDGKTETVTFNYMTPAFEAPKADKVVILNVADKLYATGTEYLYTSSSGSTKMELVLEADKAKALAYTMINNDDGTVSFKTDCGKYLFCDATDVKFVAEAGDFTKYVLEVADGGYYIKCAVANYNGKAQYLEIYNGYLTCYGMNESKTGLYIFALEDATGANGTVVPYSATENPDPDPDPDPVEAQLPEVAAPVAGTAYKFGCIQVGNGHTVYVTGEIDQDRYLVTTTDKAAALDIFVEADGEGFKFYFQEPGATYYISLFLNEAGKVSLGYKTEGTTWFYDESIHAWCAELDGTAYYMGTYNTFDTISASKTSYINADNAGVSQYPAGFFNAAVALTLPPVTAPVAGTTYKFGMIQGNNGHTVYITGAIDQDRYLVTTEDKAAALDVVVEASGNGFKFKAGDAYITLFLNDAGKTSLGYTAEGTVWTYDATISAWCAELDGTMYYMGSYNTFDTISASKTSYINEENKGVSQFPAGLFE